MIVNSVFHTRSNTLIWTIIDNPVFHTTLGQNLPDHNRSRTRQPNMIYGSNLSDKGTKKNWSDKDEHSHKSSCVNEEMLTDEGILMAIN